MNLRPHLIEAAEAYQNGRGFGRKEGYAAGLIQDRKQGIAMERSRVRKVEWLRLFIMIVLGAFVAHLINNFISIIA